MTRQPVTYKKTITISALLDRFHTVVFTLVVGSVLTIAVAMINYVVNSTQAPQDYVPTTTSTSFDTATIEKLESLRAPNEPVTPLALPNGRVDPLPE